MADTRNIENAAQMQEKIQNVPGTKKWGEHEPLREDLIPEPRSSEHGSGIDPDNPPVDKEQFFDEAERAKAKFASAAGGDTPEPVGDEKVPAEEVEAQKRLADEQQAS